MKRLAMAATLAMLPFGEAQADTMSLDRLGRPLAAVAVNGTPMTFMLDTGANRTVVEERLIGRLGLIPHSWAGVDGASGSHGAGLTTLDLQLADYEHRGAEAVIVREIGHPGIVGADTFAGRRLTLDLRAGTFTLGPSGGDCGMGYLIQGRLDRGILLFDVTIRQKTVAVLVDTGAEGVYINQALVEEIGLYGRPTRRTVIGSAGEMATERYSLPDFELAPALPIVNLQALRANPGALRDRPGIVLGLRSLSHFRRITLDYGDATVHLAY